MGRDSNIETKLKNRPTPLSRTSLILLSACVLVCTAGWWALWIIPAPPSPYEIVSAKIKVGDERGSAVAKITEAWFHGTCDRAAESLGFIDDYFFFGSKERTKATIVTVRSEKSNGKFLVTGIYLVEESMHFVILKYNYCGEPPPFIDP